MRFILSIMIAALITLSILTACQNAASLKSETAAVPVTPVPKPEEKSSMDDVPRISLADAKKDFDAGSAIFVDSRPESSYKQEHIKGAINISLEAFETRYKEIPAGKKIIAYCS